MCDDNFFTGKGKSNHQVSNCINQVQINVSVPIRNWTKLHTFVLQLCLKMVSCVQLLKAWGAHLTVTCSHNAQQLVRTLGADCVVAYTAGPVKDKLGALGWK